MRHVFQITKPKLIFCDGEYYEKLHEATRPLNPLFYTLTEHVEGVGTVEDLLSPVPNEDLYKPEPFELGGEQTVAILCSSGTTGVPKCVCVSRHTMNIDEFFATSEDVIFANSSLDWISGVFFTLLSATRSCKRVITNKPHTAEYMIALAKKYKITYALAAPRHVSALLACSAASIDTSRNLRPIRSFLVGGGSISQSTLQQLRGLLENGKVIYAYGCIESGFLSSNSDDKYPTSVGKLASGSKARIINDEGNNLPPNEIGEILVNKGHTWRGYYGNPIETRRVQDSDGWLHTGDLGYFDDKNMLYIVDRKKDIMKYDGMQYWPAEIEQVINELPEVGDVCVVGVYDERHGDAAGAIVVIRQGAELTIEQVKDHVSKRLPVDYKQLHAGVIFIDRLPQNANGKTLKREASFI